MALKVTKETMKALCRDVKLTKPQSTEKKSLIVLSAWAGARERTLQNYANFYADLGYPSIQLGVNLTHLKGFTQLASQQSFWNEAERQMYTDLMATKFEKFYSENPKYENSDVVLQCFSNNGIQTYNNVKDLIPHPVAFIFDSGPANCTFPYDFDIPGKIYRSNNPNAPIWNKAAVSFTGNVVYASRFLLYPFREMNNLPEKLVKQVPNLVGDSPSLILAGRGDFLTPPSWIAIEEKRLKDAGKEVTYVELDGIHCTMLRDSPKDYEQTIRDFFNKNDIR